MIAVMVANQGGGGAAMVGGEVNSLQVAFEIFKAIEAAEKTLIVKECGLHRAAQKLIEKCGPNQIYH